MSETELTILVVRHGHVAGIDPPRFRGREDLPLTDQGRREAQKTAAAIARRAQRPTAVYASPLHRARDTGRAIADALGTTLHAQRDLVDIYYGAWQGRTVSEVEERWPAELDRWYTEPHRAAIPGGELLSTVHDRVKRAFTEIVRAHPREEVVIVGHDSVNRVLLLLALELPQAAYWRFAQSPCAISELRITAKGTVLHVLNDTHHLGA